MDHRPDSGRWLIALGGAVAALWLEGAVGFGLAFSPGWANGWPGGLSVHVVWAAGMSLLVGLVAWTLAVALGLAIAAIGSRRGLNRRVVLVGLLAWLVLAMVPAWLAGAWAYGRVYASALEMWPGGYGVR